MVQPDRNDWQMGGNQNTDPFSHFIGTLDSIDFVFRTHGIERLRLSANGAINFGNNLNVGNTLNFSNNRVIDYKAADAIGPEVMSFGSRVSTLPWTIPCITPFIPGQVTYQFEGLMQLYGQAAGGNINVLQMGFDGVNSVIDAMGTSTDPIGNRLLLNYNCGKDVFVGKTNLGGNLTANNNLFAVGNTGLGTDDPAGYRLNVNGDINFSGNILKNGQPVLGAIWNIDNTGINYIGNVGIGISNPVEALQLGDRMVIHTSMPNKMIGYNCHWGNSSLRYEKLLNDESSALFFSESGDILLKTSPSGAANSWLDWNDVMSIRNDGHIAIGCNPENNFLLAVNGAIRCKKVKVEATSWCDFVFTDDYKLRSLNEVQNFIEANKHLPDIPSAAEIEQNGIDLAELVKLQMLKIEELTLYLIQLSKENEKLSIKVAELFNQK